MSGDNSSLHRRFYLVSQGSAAQQLADTPAPSDRTLIDLGKALAEALDEMTDIEKQIAAAHQQVRAECPLPAFLHSIRTELDASVGAGKSSVRAIIARAQNDLRRNPEALDSAKSLTQKNNEIAAFEAAMEGAYRRLGYSALHRRHRQLSWVRSELVEKIYAVPAESITGIVVKLRIVDRVEEWSQADPENDFYKAFMGKTLREAEQLAGMDMSMLREKIDPIA